MHLQRVCPLYRQYYDKGFTVFSISQDISRANWLGVMSKEDIYSFDLTAPCATAKAKAARGWRGRRGPSRRLLPISPDECVVS